MSVSQAFYAEENQSRGQKHVHRITKTTGKPHKNQTFSSCGGRNVEGNDNEPPSRFVTDDFSCRVLSDMIRSEAIPMVNALLYGVNCTKPVVVPIQKRLGMDGWDYAAWVSLDDGSEVKLAAMFAPDGDQEHSNLFLLYLDQANTPDWYENHLLSTPSFKWRGNVLLANRDGTWPANLTMDYADVTRSLAKAQAMQEGVHHVDY